MNQYLIYDEQNELMRTVSRQEEARMLVKNRLGWTFRFLRLPKKTIDLSQFEDALI
jgi:hypothetical protein